MNSSDLFTFIEVVVDQGFYRFHTGLFVFAVGSYDQQRTDTGSQIS